MSQKSMIDHFKDMLAEGRVPGAPDPFEETAKEEAEVPTEAQKEAMRLAWNNRIMNLFGGHDKLLERMLNQRARRLQRVTRRR